MIKMKYKVKSIGWGIHYDGGSVCVCVKIGIYSKSITKNIWSHTSIIVNTPQHVLFPLDSAVFQISYSPRIKSLDDSTPSAGIFLTGWGLPHK